jgi:hypothetical protein
MFGWLKRWFGGGGGAGGADHRRLMRLARGDAARTERLIAAELRRNPALTRAQAIREAAERLEYELSR